MSGADNLRSSPNRADASGERLLEHFKCEHLPGEVQLTSRLFEELAQSIVLTIDRGPERTVALRKLLEAKDSAVRARLVPGG